MLGTSSNPSRLSSHTVFFANFATGAEAIRKGVRAATPDNAGGAICATVVRDFKGRCSVMGVYRLGSLNDRGDLRNMDACGLSVVWKGVVHVG